MQKRHRISCHDKAYDDDHIGPEEYECRSEGTGVLIETVPLSACYTADSWLCDLIISFLLCKMGLIN